MDRKVVVFDQEIYNQFRYRSPRPYFHTFEAEDGQIGKAVCLKRETSLQFTKQEYKYQYVTLYLGKNR